MLRRPSVRLDDPPAAPVATPDDSPEEALRGQFTLWQMFTWTTAAAMLAATVRFTDFPPPNVAVILGGATLVFGLFVWATAWSAICKPEAAWPILVCSTSMSFIAASFAAFLATREIVEAVIAGAVSLLTMCLILCFLLVLRILGFRYVRTLTNALEHRTA